LASSPYPDPRILVLGLCDSSFAEGGIGPYLARSLRTSLQDVDIAETSSSHPDFPRLFHEYDVIILLDSVSLCSSVGQVLVVSPYALASLKGDWGEDARAWEVAIHDARMLGHQVPVIRVVAVCMPESKDRLRARTPEFESFHRTVLHRATQVVRDIIHESRAPTVSTSTG